MSALDRGAIQTGGLDRGAIQSPSVPAGGDITLTPASVVVTITVLAPVIKKVISPSPVVATITVPAPAITNIPIPPIPSHYHDVSAASADLLSLDAAKSNSVTIQGVSSSRYTLTSES